MSPDDVPLDLHRLAVKAQNTNHELPEDDQDLTPCHILAAVLPEHERQVRARVADELERRYGGTVLGAVRRLREGTL
jgi:hypothetical protein